MDYFCRGKLKVKKKDSGEKKKQIYELPLEGTR